MIYYIYLVLKSLKIKLFKTGVASNLYMKINLQNIDLFIIMLKHANKILFENLRKI